MAQCCTDGTRLIYSCSTASNVGEIADRVARQLKAEGFGTMSCLASIGAHLSGFIESAKGADESITVDGRPVACARKILEHVGIESKSFILTEMGLVKGKTPISGAVINEVYKKIFENYA